MNDEEYFGMLHDSMICNCECGCTESLEDPNMIYCRWCEGFDCVDYEDSEHLPDQYDYDELFAYDM